MGIKDDAEPPNKLLGQVLNIITPEPLSFPIKINVGGNEFMDFLPDQWWSEDNEYGHEDGSYRLVNEDISNTELDTIYASYVSRLVSYKVRLIDGIYRVKMMFCENYYEGPGKRVFDVYVEGDRVVQDLDIYALVGRYSAYDLLLEDITVTDGILDIYFSPVNFGNGPYEDRGALLNGLVIERTGELGTEQGSIGLPQKYALHHNYPNPFNPNTTIEYTLPKQANIIITIYNLLGEHVATLINQNQDTGYHKCIWNAEDQPSGVYFYKLQTESFTQVKKMLLLR